MKSYVSQPSAWRYLQHVSAAFVLTLAASATTFATDLFVVNQPVDFKNMQDNVMWITVGCTLHVGAGAPVANKSVTVGDQTHGNFSGNVSLVFTDQDVDASVRNSPHLINQVRCGASPMVKTGNGGKSFPGACNNQAASVIQQGAACKDATNAQIQ